MTVFSSPRDSIDTGTLRHSVDLLALIGADTRLRKVASTRGGEFAGPCPFCGGDDRFRVQPEHGLWWCRSCGGDRWQDSIGYVMQRDAVSFTVACERLGSAYCHGSNSARAFRAEQDTPAPSTLLPAPSGSWQEAGEAMVTRCESALWSDIGAKARGYLHRRGLTDETIHTWRLGYQTQDAIEPAATWGLDGKPLHIARGIVIPWHFNDQLWQIKIRRPGDHPKYAAVKGGHPVIFGAHTLTLPVAALVEGEFDAMLLHQESGFIVGVSTLGSASKALDPRALLPLLTLDRILVAYDGDSEGQRGADRLASLSARIGRVQIPSPHKDVTELYQAGYRLRDWIESAAARDAFTRRQESLILPGLTRDGHHEPPEALEPSATADLVSPTRERCSDCPTEFALDKYGSCGDCRGQRSADEGGAA